jgi:hypothetical protein
MEYAIKEIKEIKSLLDIELEKSGLLVASLRAFNTGFAVAKGMPMGENSLYADYKILDRFPEMASKSGIYAEIQEKLDKILELINSTIEE